MNRNFAVRSFPTTIRAERWLNGWTQRREDLRIVSVTVTSHPELTPEVIVAVSYSGLPIPEEKEDEP